MGSKKLSYHKERNFSENCFIFWKVNFGVGTSYQQFIWCTTHPIVHIHIFRKPLSFIWRYVFSVSILKVNELRYKQCGVTPQLSTGQNLLKKVLRKDKYWQNLLKKISRKDIDRINWEKLFDRSADYKWWNIPWTVKVFAKADTSFSFFLNISMCAFCIKSIRILNQY